MIKIENLVETKTIKGKKKKMIQGKKIREAVKVAKGK